MDFDKAFLFAFSGTWIIVGIVFLAVGIGIGRALRRKEERQRANAEGVVLEMLRHTSHSRNGESVSWRPLVEFDYEGRRISLEGDTVSRKKYYEGQRVQLYYDPDDPACFRIEGEGGERIVSRVFTVVGAVCLGIGIVSAVLMVGGDALRRQILFMRWQANRGR